MFHGPGKKKLFIKLLIVNCQLLIVNEFPGLQEANEATFD